MLSPSGRANFESELVFRVRSANTATGPWTYTVGLQAEIVDGWNFVMRAP